MPKIPVDLPTWPVLAVTMALLLFHSSDSPLNQRFRETGSYELPSIGSMAGTAEELDLVTVRLNRATLYKAGQYQSNKHPVQCCALYLGDFLQS